MADEGFVVSQSDLAKVAKLDEAFISIIAKAAREAGEFLAGRAKENAPIDSGDLRASIQSRLVKTGEITEVSLEATEDYALRMHEELTPFGPLNLGAGSQAAAAQPTAEGGPGGKFLARVVDFNIQKIQKDIGRALEAEIPLKIEGKASRGEFRPGAFFPPERFEGA